MEYRRFGRTGMQMSVLSLGGMRFQAHWDRSDRIPRASQENVEKIIDRAVQLGINHFETARGYGTSEKQLGRILPSLPREEIFVQTKVGPRDSTREFLADVEDSMKTLGVDYLDLLALHGINTDDILRGCLKKRGIVDAMLRLKRRGIVKHIGFSTHGPPQVNEKTIRASVFDFVNLWYSMIYRDNWHAIMEARRRDMGVFIISPNDKGGMLFAPPAKLKRLTRPLSPMQYNDLFILSHRQIHTISCGAARPSDLTAHADAIDRSARLKATVKRITGRLDEAMREAVGARWSREYTSGLPDWSRTPGEMNIPVILWLRNLALAFGMVEYGKMRYNLLGNAGHWFPGLKADRLDALDPAALRRALRRSPFKDDIVGALRETDLLLSGKEVKRLGGRH